MVHSQYSFESFRSKPPNSYDTLTPLPSTSPEIPILPVTFPGPWWYIRSATYHWPNWLLVIIGAGLVCAKERPRQTAKVMVFDNMLSTCGRSEVILHLQNDREFLNWKVSVGGRGGAGLGLQVVVCVG